MKTYLIPPYVTIAVPTFAFMNIIAVDEKWSQATGHIIYMINTFSERLRHSCAYTIVMSEKKMHLKPTAVTAQLQRKCAIIFTRQIRKFLNLMFIGPCIILIVE